MRIVVKCVDSSPLDVCDNRADVVANVTCMLLDGGRETVGGRDREREREREKRRGNRARRRERERETEMERESREWEGVWINRDGQREVPRKSLLLHPLARITSPPVVRVHRKRSDNPFMCSLRIESSEQW